ncbi:Hsp70 family protein [Pelagibius sp.]|uniref:Hsp70 family protein n=1 Tax=Pelagibius sp. TaxID=1931238 RepID=UPI003B50CD2E
MQANTLAIDFGTSNSAAAVMREGAVHRIPIEGRDETLPTAVFFPAGQAPMRIGMAATEALTSGEEGRYLRALKSVLGLPLAHEERLIGGRRRSVVEIIAAFLRELRQRAETATGQRFRYALSGRPVHFHSSDPRKDRQAEQDLHACYLAAGFDAVTFLAEPEAAALASRTLRRTGDIGVVVDIGGGTSDFSVFRTTQSGPVILASHGIRLGGTDFDQAIALSHCMPLLGLGGELRSETGPGLLPVPSAPYVDLATWAKIPFLYNAETRRRVAQMRRLAVDPTGIARLASVLELELGHELGFAVERGKIAANEGQDSAVIEMGFVEAGLTAPLARNALVAALADREAEIAEAVSETLVLAGVDRRAVRRVVLVGGSSLMALVSRAVLAVCPSAEMRRAGAFTAVVDGLAFAAAQMERETVFTG